MKHNVEAAAVESNQVVLEREAFTQCRTGSIAEHLEGGGVVALMAKRTPQFGALAIEG